MEGREMRAAWQKSELWCHAGVVSRK